MVEGTSDHITEAQFLDALFLAHDVIKKQVIWQQEIMKEVAAALALLPALAWSAHAQFTAGTVASYAGQSFTTGGVTYSFPT